MQVCRGSGRLTSWQLIEDIVLRKKECLPLTISWSRRMCIARPDKGKQD
jgi:hypothetical protein